MPEVLSTSPQESFLFDLEPFFQADVLNLKEQDYIKITGAISKYPKMRYFPYPNPYIENEIKGYGRHLIVEERASASTISAYFTNLFHPIAGFLKEVHPDCRSIIEYDYETLEKEHNEYLKRTNHSIVCKNTLKRFDKNLNTVEYNHMTDYYYKFRNFYNFIYRIRIGNHIPEYEKDMWDIRRLGIRYNVCISRPHWIISFQRISQPWLVDAVKKFEYYRIPVMTMAACLDDIKGLNLFSQFLREEHPEVDSMRCMNRELIEDYMAYLHTLNFAGTTANRRLSVLRTFLRIGSYLELPDFPDKTLILCSDFAKRVVLMPKYFTENELQQINRHIGELPKQIARMLFVLENCGMRVSDICETKIEAEGKYCLTTSNEGNYIFTYYMPKSKKHNTIPVSTVVGLVLEDAIKESREKYGKNCVYVFAKSEKTPIATETFTLALNEMAYRNQLKNDNGEPMHIAGHTFRGTVATRYVNMGINLELIRSMLGQSKINVLRHYMTIHSATMIEYMRPIMEEANDRILNIGKKENVAQKNKEPDSNLISLPNGWCEKSRESGICSHANACYSCRMFHPEKSHLPIYKAQLAEAENNILIAELNGYTRLLEQNRSQAGQWGILPLGANEKLPRQPPPFENISLSFPSVPCTSPCCRRQAQPDTF